jgi:nicotinamide mononucleotide transporter
MTAMDTVIQAIEIFAAVTGVLYVVLEILQKNSMWVVGILTGAACAFEFAVTHVWASMGLNLYYVVMSVIGLVQWRKASEAMGKGEIHLARIPKAVAIWSVVLFVVGSLVLMQVLRISGDPAPRLDAVAVTLSIIATWWLAQSYLQQWLLWVVADVFTTTLCLATGQYWMAALYLAYIASAVYGYFHWKRRGKYLSLKD